jgi:hypothetical protein
VVGVLFGSVVFASVVFALRLNLIYCVIYSLAFPLPLGCTQGHLTRLMGFRNLPTC